MTSNQINSFQINQSDGSLTAINSVTSNQCRTAIVDPSGKYVFATEDVGGSAGKINKFIILSNGGLQSNGSIALGLTTERLSIFENSGQKTFQWNF